MEKNNRYEIVPANVEEIMKQYWNLRWKIGHVLRLISLVVCALLLGIFIWGTFSLSESIWFFLTCTICMLMLGVLMVISEVSITNQSKNKMETFLKDYNQLVLTYKQDAFKEIASEEIFYYITTYKKDEKQQNSKVTWLTIAPIILSFVGVIINVFNIKTQETLFENIRQNISALFDNSEMCSRLEYIGIGCLVVFAMYLIAHASEEERSSWKTSLKEREKMNFLMGYVFAEHERRLRESNKSSNSSYMNKLLKKLGIK